MIRVLLFGPVAERAGVPEVSIPYARGMTLQDAAAYVNAAHPEAYAIVSFIAVNEVQARDMQLKLSDNDEIAFMAKFSGG